MSPPAFTLLALAWPALAGMLCAQAAVPAFAYAQASPPSVGPVPEYRTVPRKSTVRFKAETGVPLMPVVQGSVQRYEVRSWIDLSNPMSSRAEAVIEMRSVKSESLLVSDAAIRAQLKVEQYPTATLRTLAVRKTDKPNVFEVDVEFVCMSTPYRSAVKVEAVRFEGYMRLIGSYRARSEAGRESMLEFSLYVEPR